MDTDRPVLQQLQADAAQAGLQNLSTLCCSAGAVEEIFDVAVMAFFGHPVQLLFDCMKIARKKLIRIVDVNQGQAHSPKRQTAKTLSAALDAANCTYLAVDYSTDFGQPLKSAEDAEAFIRCSHPGIPPKNLSLLLEQDLMQTGRAAFPFYLKKQKDLRIFIIDTSGFA